MKNKNQNHILANGDRKQVIIRGLDLSNGQAKIYAQEYLGNVNSLKEITGQQALAYAIFDTKIVDIDAGYVI
jgi:hypothetical protein